MMTNLFPFFGQGACLRTGGYLAVRVVTEGEEGLLVEASAAGDYSVVPLALLFGVFIGVLYDVFRILRTSLGLRREIHVSALTSRLRGMHRRPVTQPPVKRLHRNPSPKTQDSAVQSEDVVPGRGAAKKQTHQTQQRTVKAAAVSSVKKKIGRYFKYPRKPLDTQVPRKHLPLQAVQFLLDILFFILCGALFSVFVYHRNAGELRWYVIAASLLGFFAWYETAGRAVMRFTALILAVLRAVVLILFNYILYYPCRIGYRLFSAVWNVHVTLCERWENKHKKRVEVRNAKRAKKKAAAISETYKKNKNETEGTDHGKRKKAAKEKSKLFYKNRVFRFPRILRNHHLPHGHAD
ncbi:MAG: spore cortex biosynthesis protein YabQ [Clostridia bacterium]|nr:spore cortex biosynthesis protein YabQ [Clostridia bacterium]